MQEYEWVDEVTASWTCSSEIVTIQEFHVFVSTVKEKNALEEAMWKQGLG